MAFTLVTNDIIVARTASALFGVGLGATNLAKFSSLAGTNPNALLNSVYVQSVGTASTASVADVLIVNLGITDATAVGIAKNFIIAQLNAVDYTLRGQTINTMLNQFSQLTSDATFGAAATAWNNKVSNAVAYGNQSGNPDTTFDVASGGTGGGSTTIGQTFLLTTGVDTLGGTAGNDTYIADNTGTAQSSIADSINGGNGTDTLKIYSKGTGSTLDLLPQLTSVENLYINGGEYSTKTLDLSAITGLTSLTIDTPVDAAGNATYKLAGQSVTLKNETTASAMKTTLASTADTAANLTLSSVATTGGATIDLSGTKVATLNLTSTGAANTITLTDSGAALATIKISGDQALTLTGSATGFATTGIATLDASAATGATTVTLVAGGAATTGDNLATNFAYTGGTGADSLDLTNATVANVAVTAAQLNAMTLNGGTGVDTLILNNAVVTGATALTTLSNIEIIGDAAVNGTVNFTNFGTATGFKFTGTGAGSVAGAVTINNLASSATLDYGTATVGGNAVTVNAIGSGTTDALTVTLGSSAAAIGASTAATTINGYETVNITSQGAANTLAAVTLGASAGGAETLNVTLTKALTTGNLALSGSSTVVNVSGAGALTTGTITAGTFTDTGTGAITVATGSNILNFNSGTNNANTSILDTAASSAASITTGNGTNTITGGAFNDVIKTGTGANTITGGVGADSITVGTHNGTTVVDKIVQAAAGDSGAFAVPAANTISTSTFDVVTGLLKGDQISLTADSGVVGGALGLAAANATTATTLVGLTVADNNEEFVRGTYTAATNTFVGSATGTDTLVVYDGNATVGATAAEAIVLVGYVAAGVTGINGAAGLITLG